MENSVLVINLTRLGDLLQSQPLFDELAANNFTCGLLCLENFTGALPMLRHVKDAWLLRGASLLAAKNSSWPGAVGEITDFVRAIRSQGRYSWILNLTPSNPARLLARLLALDGARVAGFDIDENGFGLNNGVWASFLSVSSRHRGNSPFNVADIFRMTALPLLGDKPAVDHCGRLAAPGPEARAWAKEFLQSSPASASAKGFVALQLGASAAVRQWPVEYFCRLAKALRDNGYCCVLVGDARERPLADAFANLADFPFVDALGQTHIPQLGAILEKCRLLVTNDTGTMHLASGLGTRCLAFFLATAQPWDTGPYAPGNCCLEPALDCHPCPFGRECEKDEVCRFQIEPVFARDLALACLETGNWRNGLSSSLLAKTRVWLTDRDSCGFASLTCLSGHENRGKSAWLGMERFFWRQLLDDLAGHEPACALVKPDIAPQAAYARQAAPVLAQAAKDMESLRNVTPLVGKNARAGAIFLKGCEQIQNLFDCCPPLLALGDFWREIRHSTPDVDKFANQLGIFARHLRNFALYLQTGGARP